MWKKLIHAATKSKTLFDSRPNIAPNTTTTTTPPLEEGSSAALRIIHAGGIVEQYYMAIPAARIIDKYYPAFTLTRPDVFKRPWNDAVVRPEEILVPGQKYFVVPRRTVIKLKRRMNKSSSGGIKSKILFNSVGKMENYCEKKKNESSFSTGSRNSSFMIKSKNKARVRNFRVRFFGVDTCKQDIGSSSSEHSIYYAESTTEKGQNYARKRRAGNILQWEPSLTSITEYHDTDE